MEADQAGKLRNDSKLEGLRKGRKEADEILDGKVIIYIYITISTFTSVRPYGVGGVGGVGGGVPLF